MRTSIFSVTLSLLAAACVGDDPVIANGPAEDAGVIDASTVTDSGGHIEASTVTDAGPDTTPPLLAPPLLGPILWLDARKLPTGATPSTTWADSSGNSNTATSGIALSVAPNAINGKPALFLPGQKGQALAIQPNDALAFNVGNGFLVAFVAKTAMPAALRTAQAVLFDRSKVTGGIFPNVMRAGSAMFLDSALTNVSAHVYTSTGGQIDNKAQVSPTDMYVPHVYVFRLSAEQGLKGKLTTWVDGQSNATQTFDANDFSVANSEPFAIAGYSKTDAAQFTYSGHIGEVLVYNRTVIDDDVKALIIKLSTEWGIP